jgi:hypothetical protein
MRSAFLSLALIAVIATASAARAAERAPLPEDGWFAQVSLVGSGLGFFGLGFAPLSAVAVGDRHGQNAWFADVSLGYAVQTTAATTGVLSDGTAFFSGDYSSHTFSGSIAPTYRRYLSAPAAGELVPFAQAAVSLGLSRSSSSTSGVSNGLGSLSLGGDPALLWQLGAAGSLGGEYFIGEHVGLEVRATARASYAFGKFQQGGGDSTALGLGLGGAAALDLHW